MTLTNEVRSRKSKTITRSDNAFLRTNNSNSEFVYKTKFRNLKISRVKPYKRSVLQDSLQPCFKDLDSLQPGLPSSFRGQGASKGTLAKLEATYSCVCSHVRPCLVEIRTRLYVVNFHTHLHHFVPGWMYTYMSRCLSNNGGHVC